MAFSKKDSFEDRQARLATFAKALGHPARIAILRVLAEKNRCICGEIVDVLPLSQSTVSQHLKALKDVGLIRGEIEGPRSCYCIDQTVAAEFKELADDLLNTLVSGAPDNCCAPETERSSAMSEPNEIKQLVKQKYGEIAHQSFTQNASSCCGSGGCCSDSDLSVFAEDYSKLDGYQPEADLGLGCGIPTAFAQIRAGQTVVDLGSGAGNDVFISRKMVGPTGRVIGVDMTDEMIAKARANNEKFGFTNVEFRQGDIEQMPVENGIADVVISNCVLNLVPDKNKAFSEIFRVLKPGGHFSISDMVLDGKLPEGLAKAAEMYVGCVAGAIQKSEYLGIIEKTGFTAVTIEKDRATVIPDEILSKYLKPTDIDAFKKSGASVRSITVYGQKPA
jgi:arsenite methyltransferase